MRARVFLLLLSTAGGAACNEGMPPTVTVADSAGVTIVTNVAGSVEASTTWMLSTSPAVDFGGGAEPEIPLYRISAVSPLESGDVAVGTTVPPGVLVFDRTGALVASLGREGEGPGEFMSVGSAVGVGTDSIAVWDPDRRRISVFNDQGAFEREVDLSGVSPQSARASGGTQTASGFTHLLPSIDGSLIVFAEAALGPTTDRELVRHELPTTRVDPAGTVLADYGPFPGLHTSPGVASPFGARTHAASMGETLLVGTSESTEFRAYGPDGELTRITRWPDGDRTVGGAFFDRWMEMLSAEDPGLGEYILSSPRPESYPAYDDLLVDRDGWTFVADYPGPLGVLSLRRGDQGPEALKAKLRMPARRWLVFDPDGALTATVETPEGFEPYTVHDEMIWGVYSDELDVESVRAYVLDRG